MSVRPSLWLHEELLLLTLEAWQGRLPWSSTRGLALGGAVLLELTLTDRIRLDTSKRSKLVMISNTSLLGDPLLDEWLERMRATRNTSARNWVSRIGSTRGLPHRIAERLWLKAVVRREERPFLLFFTQRVYPMVNTGVTRTLIERLRAALLEQQIVSPRDAALLGLLRHAGALRAVFSAQEIKQQSRRIKQIAQSSAGARAVTDALAAVHAAIMAAG
ncbi:MAG: GOLPH3/VPS74 family protein [Longimicrobiales bacterium]